MEANRTEICSGWRPLFGTLRVANARNNAAAILEVFRIFLSTDNTLVFANAALDYILCLLSHIRNAEDVSAQKNEEGKASAIDMCRECLKLLQSCAQILGVMYNMPKCPTFNLTHRVSIDTEPQLVDPVIQGPEIVSFRQDCLEQMNSPVFNIKVDMENCIKENITLLVSS